MSKHLNQQNKLHFALFDHYEDVNKRGDHMDWPGEAFLFMNADRLNKRIGRISPRRGKAEIERVAEALCASDNMDMEVLSQLAELFDDENEIL